MVSAIQYILATEADIPAMEAVGKRLFDHAIVEERALEFFRDPRHHLWLAYDGAAVVGMASGFHYVHPDKDPQLFVNEVGVLKSHQNRGIGRTLVRKLCLYAQRMGCQEAWIATESSNRSARKAFVAAGGKEFPEPIVLLNFDLELPT